MATKAGVWIDHKQAIVVLISEAGQEIKKVKSGLEQAKRPAGTRSKSAYTPNDFIAEDKRERKIEAEQKAFYDEVLTCIRGVESLLILGPGEAKGEFVKHIKAKKLRVVVELETTDKMTDRQIAARVAEHFASPPASKSTVPKKSAKKATTASPAKHLKKTRKK